MRADLNPNRGSAKSTLFVLYAVLAAYALITLMPFIWMLITSFKEPRDVFKLPPSFVPKLLFTDEPFANYSEIWTKRDFVIYFRNSAFVSFMASIGQVFACSLAGYAFARLELPGKNWLFALSGSLERAMPITPRSNGASLNSAFRSGLFEPPMPARRISLPILPNSTSPVCAMKPSITR